MNVNYKYKFGKVIYDLKARTYIMGILNVTPDSFSDGGKFFNKEDAFARARKMISEGADFIDIGGQSSKPGAKEVTVEEEIGRVIPVIKDLSKETQIPISIDTYRSEVAEEALKHGAVIVNDISAFNLDPSIIKVVAKYQASCILMHMKGTPADMQNNPHYNNMSNEILIYFEKSIGKAKAEGIKQIIIDPGFGFGKNTEHNLKLIKNINEFKKLNYPIMIGVSRKSTIGKILNAETNERLEGTLALNTISIINGVNILRVHDVKENLKMARISDVYKKI